MRASSSLRGLRSPAASIIWLTAACVAGEAILFNATAGGNSPEVVWLSGGHSASVTAVAYSQDGQLILTGANDNTVKLWRASDQGLLFTVEGVVRLDRAPCPPALSPDSALIAVGASHEIRLFR